MYLNIMKNKKTGKTSLSICKGFRDETGKVKHKTVKTLGLLLILTFKATKTPPYSRDKISTYKKTVIVK